MVYENLSDVLISVSPQITEDFSDFITFFKAIGILFIIYVVYLIFNFILNIKKNRRIKKIEEKVDLIEEKINQILKTKKKTQKRR
jgi:Fe2+ transport system protein B